MKLNRCRLVGLGLASVAVVAVWTMSLNVLSESTRDPSIPAGLVETEVVPAESDHGVSTLPQSATAVHTLQSPEHGTGASGQSGEGVDGAPDALGGKEPDRDTGENDAQERDLRKLSEAQVLARLGELPHDRSHLDRLDSRLNFTNMDLSRAELEATDLRFANFERSDLTGANLAFADLRRAILVDADLGDATLSGADIRATAMYGTNLKGADLRNTNAAMLRIAEGQYAGAIFDGADLRDTDLRGADLQGAMLLSADLRGADLRDANLMSTVLSGTVYDHRTRFPPGFDPSAMHMVFRDLEASN